MAKFIGAGALIIYGIFFDKKTFLDVIHDEQVQKGIDICAVSFYTYFTYVRLFCGGITLHTFCENLFFYVGGALTLLWGIYRALSQYEDYKMKKQATKFQKKVFEQADKL